MSSKLRTVRTGVIGVGSMGQNHARVYSEISNLVGISDLNVKQGKKIAKSLGIDFYSDYRDLIGKVDAVSIAVPTTYHYPIAKDFANAGIHLLVEKPLAQSVEEAEKIISVADKAGIILGVGHIERHNEVIKNSKKYLESGLWGKPITFSARRFSSYPNRIRDVGVVFDLTIHDVDVLSYLANSEVHSVYASGGNFMNQKYEDHVILCMEFVNGSIGLCETNWLTPIKVRDVSITTDKYFINVDYIKQEIHTFKSDYSKIDNSNLYKSRASLNEEVINLEKVEPLKSELCDFLESIIEAKSPLVSGEEGLKAVNIVEKSLESMLNGNKINI